MFLPEKTFTDEQLKKVSEWEKKNPFLASKMLDESLTWEEYVTELLEELEI